MKGGGGGGGGGASLMYNTGRMTHSNFVGVYHVVV